MTRRKRLSVVITPGPSWHSGGLREVLDHLELLRILAYRDVAVRYKQTAMEIAWVVLQPLVTMLVFAVLFRALHAGGSLPAVPINGTAEAGG